jgi:acyl-CoA synthetase (AMP-forming)/AMP-acid ligase II
MSRAISELDRLRTSARRHPDAVAVAWEGHAFTFAELDRLADDIAELLPATPPRVGIALRNGPAWIPLLMAVWSRGGEAVLFASSLPDATLAQRARREGVGVLVVDRDRAEDLAALGAWRTVGVAGTEVAVVPGSGPAGAPVTPDAAVSEPGVVLFTSGTSGEPKPVRLPAAVLLGIIDRIIGHLTAGSRTAHAHAPDTGAQPGPPKGCYLVAFPLYHVSGLYLTLLALARCVPAVTLEKFSAGAFLDSLEQWPITQVVLNPTMFGALLDSTDPRTDRLMKQLRFIRNGTAPLPADLREAFAARFGVPILQGYGSTETGGEVIGWTVPDFRRFGATHAASVGRASPGVSIRIVDEDGRELPPGRIGRVAIRVPWLSERYRDIGDLGHLDEHGFLFLAGRADDVINRGGFMIHPLEVEEALRRCAGVLDCAVVGEPDPRLGEAPVAYIVAGAGGVDPDGVRRALRDRLPPYQCPREIHVVAELPRNDLGKLLRGALRAAGTGTTP